MSRRVDEPLLRFEAKLEKRDAWVGLFWDRKQSSSDPFGDGIVWDDLHIYVCPLPFVVLHWTLTRITTP